MDGFRGTKFLLNGVPGLSLFVCSLLTRGWQVESLVGTTALLRKGGWVLTDRSGSVTVIQDEEDGDGKVWTGWPWSVVGSVLIWGGEGIKVSLLGLFRGRYRLLKQDSLPLL